MNKRILIAIIAVLMLGGVFAVYCLLLQKGIRHDTKPLKKITLGVETSLLPVSVWVAENRGYFKEKGIDLTIKGFDSGKLSFLAMLNSEVDISTVAPTPIIFKSFERQDFCIFATFVYSYDDVKVIACKDSGINNAQDLKGKRIGTPFGTTGQFVMDAFLIHNRILNSEVDMIDIAPSNLPAALKNKQVDAIVIWEPHAYNAWQLMQDETIRLQSFDIYKETFNFMAKKDFAANNKKRTLDLENYKDNLEKLAQDRTKELNTANEQLIHSERLIVMKAKVQYLQWPFPQTGAPKAVESCELVVSGL